MIFNNEKGLNVCEYGLTSHAIDDQLKQISENLWQIDFGTDYWNPAVYCSTQGQQGIMSDNPSADREWYSVDGDAAETSKLIVYWTGTESPRVVYGMGQRPMVRLTDCHDCTLDIQGAVAGYGVYIQDCSNIKLALKCSEMGRGVHVLNSTDIHINDSDLSQFGECGLFIKNSSGVFENNHLYDGLLSQSTGGIYMSHCDSGKRVVRGNTVSRMARGNYWPSDGCAIYTEHGTANTKVYNNKALDCVVAFQDNSGMPGNRFYGNEIYGCEYSWQHSDSENHGQGDTEFEDNILFQSGEKANGDGVLPANNMRIGMRYD